MMEKHTKYSIGTEMKTYKIINSNNNSEICDKIGQKIIKGRIFYLTTLRLWSDVRNCHLGVNAQPNVANYLFILLHFNEISHSQMLVDFHVINWRKPYYICIKQFYLYADILKCCLYCVFFLLNLCVCWCFPIPIWTWYLFLCTFSLTSLCVILVIFFHIYVITLFSVNICGILYINSNIRTSWRI